MNITHSMTFTKLWGFFFSPGLEITIYKFPEFSIFSMTVRTLYNMYGFVLDLLDQWWQAITHWLNYRDQSGLSVSLLMTDSTH